MRSFYAWMRGHPLVVDSLLAAAVALLGLIAIGVGHVGLAVELPFIVAMSAPVALRRRYPVGAFAAVVAAGGLDELLGHEERFWLGSAGRLGLLAGAAGMSSAALRQIVAAGALLGAASKVQAMELLGRVPGAVASEKVACWLRDLYPPDAGPSAGGDTE